MELKVDPLYILEAHEGTVVSIVQPFPNSDYILTLSNDKFVLLWNLSYGNLLNEITSEACPTKLFVFSKLGFLFIPNWDNSFSLIDLTIFCLPTKKIIELYFPENEIVFYGHKSWVLHAIELEDEEKFLTCSRDKTIRLWNILSTNCEMVYSEHKGNVNYIINLEENLIASCSSDKTIKVWNVAKKNSINSNCCKLTIFDGNYPVFQIEKVKNNYIVSRNESPTMKIWDYLTGKLHKVLEGHFTNVICMKVLKNNNIISGSYDHTAKIWNKDSNKAEMTLYGHEFTIYNICECKNGNILTASGDGTIKLWDLKKKKCMEIFIGHIDYVVSLLCTKNNEFVSGGYDGYALIWKIKNYS